MNCIKETTEIEEYIKVLKNMLEDKMTKINICSHRDKNFSFYYLYNIRKAYIIETLKNLEVQDFKFKTKNTNKKYQDEYLYVFSKVVTIANAVGENVRIELYIKISIIKEEKRIITISFHEAKYSFT